MPCSASAHLSWALSHDERFWLANTSCGQCSEVNRAVIHRHQGLLDGLGERVSQGCGQFPHSPPPPATAPCLLPRTPSLTVIFPALGPSFLPVFFSTRILTKQSVSLFPRGWPCRKGTCACCGSGSQSNPAARFPYRCPPLSGSRGGGGGNLGLWVMRTVHWKSLNLRGRDSFRARSKSPGLLTGSEHGKSPGRKFSHRPSSSQRFQLQLRARDRE